MVNNCLEVIGLIARIRFFPININRRINPNWDLNLCPLINVLSHLRIYSLRVIQNNFISFVLEPIHHVFLINTEVSRGYIDNTTILDPRIDHVHHQVKPTHLHSPNEQSGLVNTHCVFKKSVSFESELWLEGHFDPRPHAHKVSSET
jgi:hypothetical protein